MPYFHLGGLVWYGLILPRYLNQDFVSKIVKSIETFISVSTLILSLKGVGGAKQAEFCLFQLHLVYFGNIVNSNNGNMYI